MFGYKKYVTVIMDGSDRYVVREILGIVNMVTKRRFGKMRCRKLDSNHPTMKIIKTWTNAETYRQMRRTIELQYPGLCAFDVTI